MSVDGNAQPRPEDAGRGWQYSGRTTRRRVARFDVPMALIPGSRFGPYEIIASIGAGGMGEVYRARDTTLNRDVALKVLPASVAQDPERLARLRREAQVLASLNHPNIAHIYGFETAGAGALVLELVEGPTLADRIARGALTPAEALDIARQIASALAAAHDAGIVHRDLKPANVKVRDDGTVKVLDFGLAKATSGTAVIPDAADSPTMTSPVMTTIGTVLGTAAYMAPEQARGRPVDARADIWAFGVVLVEMVTGRRVFDAETMSDTMAAVLTREPDLEGVPPAMRRLVRACLVKDPAHRLRHIGDAMTLVNEPATAPAAHARTAALRWAWLAALALTAVVVAALTWLFLRPPPAEGPTTRFLIDAPAGAAFNYTYTATAISPDGRQVVFRVATSTGAPALWLRPLDSLDARPIPGTDRGDFPFWSPDGRSLAYFAAGRLERVDVGGGAPIVLCDASDTDTAMTGGAWNKAGAIIFGAPQGLYLVSASGGTPSLILPVSAANRETGVGFPQFLPDGDRFLLFVRSDDAAHEGMYVSSLSHPDRKTLVLATNRKAVVVANDTGREAHLLYLQDRTLLARPLDLSSLAWTGAPASVAANLALFPPGFHASFWASAAAGVLAYRTESSDRPRLTWADADGTVRRETGTEDFYTHVRLSPDGTRAVVELTEDKGSAAIWMWDFVGRVKTRRTFNAKPDRFPIWAPNGHEIAFGSLRSGTLQIYRKDLTGGQPEQALTDGPGDKTPADWSRDGRYLLYTQNGATTSEDIWALPVAGDRKPFPVLRTPAIETTPALSPDGQWLAFESSQSGRPEVYVMRFLGPASTADAPGPRWQVSTQGGSSPRWSGDGRALFFLALDERSIQRAAVRAVGDGFQSDAPSAFTDLAIMSVARSPFDVSADGRRVLLLERTVNRAAPLVVVTNGLVPSGR